jgi:hypothetical protein
MLRASELHYLLAPVTGACSNLTSSNEDICMAARQGVKVLVSSVKLDKQTTHHALRPHIKDLGDHRKLTVTMLQVMLELQIG